MAVEMNQVMANTTASATAVPRPAAGDPPRTGGSAGAGGAGFSASPSGAGRGTGAWPCEAPCQRAVVRRGSRALSGRPSTRCSPIQPRQAPRQPQWLSMNAESGQPTVLANPASSVMPVMASRAPLP